MVVAWVTPVDEQETRAILATRLSSLAQGYSGVSWELLERLVVMLNENMLPLIPKRGQCWCQW